jgi:AraC family transcriptional regulator, positive regulator of tynA and feaB
MRGTSIVTGDALSPSAARLPAERVRSDALLELSTDDVRPAESLDYWREMVLRLFADVQIAAKVEDGFHGRMRSRYLGGLRMTVVDATSQSVERRHREARAQYEDCYFAVLMLDGTQWLEQDGRRVRLAPGDFALYDAARPHKLTFSRQWGEIILNIPRAHLDRELEGARHCTATRVASEHGVGALLRTYLHGLAHEMGTLRTDELSRLSQHTVGLIGTALAGIRPDATALPRGRQHSLVRAKAVVEQHLTDPLLDTATIAAALHMSTRYLNKLFEEERTSLMRYVWGRRLERCREDLQDASRAALRIGDIAMRWGFNDLSHFSRAFRERFGESPRDCRRRAGIAASGD